MELFLFSLLIHIAQDKVCLGVHRIVHNILGTYAKGL